MYFPVFTMQLVKVVACCVYTLPSAGNWWEGTTLTEEWYDNEIYGTEAGACPEVVLPHWTT